MKTGFTVNSCLQFVETELALKAGSKLIDLMGGFVPMEMVVKGITLQMFKSDVALIVRVTLLFPKSMRSL